MLSNHAVQTHQPVFLVVKYIDLRYFVSIETKTQQFNKFHEETGFFLAMIMLDSIVLF